MRERPGQRSVLRSREFEPLYFLIPPPPQLATGSMKWSSSVEGDEQPDLSPAVRHV